jgi:hypothetical protein
VRCAAHSALISEPVNQAEDQRHAQKDQRSDSRASQGVFAPRRHVTRRLREHGLRVGESRRPAVATNNREMEKPRGGSKSGALPDGKPGLRGLRAFPSIESTGSAVVGSLGIDCLHDRPDDDAGGAENELHGSRYLGALRSLRHRPDLATCINFSITWRPSVCASRGLANDSIEDWMGVPLTRMSQR